MTCKESGGERKGEQIKREWKSGDSAQRTVPERQKVSEKKGGKRERVNKQEPHLGRGNLQCPSTIGSAE